MPALARAAPGVYVTSSLSATALPLAAPSDTDAHVVLAADLMSLLGGAAPASAQGENETPIPSPTSRAATGPANSPGLRIGMIVFLAVGCSIVAAIFGFFYVRRIVAGVRSCWRHDARDSAAGGTSTSDSSASSSGKTEESVELGLLPDAQKSQSSVAPLLPVTVTPAHASEKHGHYDGGAKKPRGAPKPARPDNAALVGARQAAAGIIAVSLDDEKAVCARRRSRDVADAWPAR
ncbi:hypothetical protein AURDEDRAFT_113347 [Auricularia subglabra TFB-10046 SS5]|nr:hypothetical protein AURDEDRAFT_113347 [Auricularia subglabra TFB-10046 SS5]